MENQEIIKVEENSTVELYKVEIDTQIATAKQYPRVVPEIIKEVAMLATLDKDTAASCFYSKPVGGGKTAEGASVRFAEIVFGAWGNLRVRTFIKEENQTSIIAVCEIHDLQKNSALSSEVSRSIISKKYGRFTASVIETNKMAILSIAFRNAVLKIVPKGLFDATLKQVKDASVDDKLKTDKASLQDALHKAFLYFKQLNVKEDEIFKTLNVKDIESLTTDHYATLTGFRTAIAEKTETVDSIFRIKTKPESDNNHFEDIKDLPENVTNNKKK